LNLVFVDFILSVGGPSAYLLYSDPLTTLREVNDSLGLAGADLFYSLGGPALLYLYSALPSFFKEHVADCVMTLVYVVASLAPHFLGVPKLTPGEINRVIEKVRPSSAPRVSFTETYT